MFDRNEQRIKVIRLEYLRDMSCLQTEPSTRVNI